MEMYDTVTDNRQLPRAVTVEDFSERLNDRWNEDALRRSGSTGWNQERDYSVPAMGLMGEAGEAGEFFKKFIRDGKPVWRNQGLALELGDVLHYLCRCAHLAGYDIGEIAAMNEQKITERRFRGVDHA